MLSNQIYGSDVRSLQVYGGDLYIGGSFNVLGGTTAVHRIVRYEGQTMHPTGGGTDAEVNPATIFAMTEWNGELCCGGEFDGVVQPGAPSTPSTAVYHIASFDGARWARLGSGDWGFSAEAKALGWWRGKRVAGGRMQFAGDAMVNGLAAFAGEGWQRLGTFDGVIWDMLEWNGDLWVVGDFRTAGGVPANGVARYDGTRWYSLAGGPNLLGCYGIALPSPRRAPYLQAFGAFAAGDTLHLTVSSAEEQTPLVLVLGTQRVDTPLFGGTLVPNGDIAALMLATDAVGVARFDVFWPRLPSGFACYGQAWCWDPSMPASVAATNGVILRQP